MPVLPEGWRISGGLNPEWVIGEEHTLELEALGYVEHNSRLRWHYTLRRNGEVIFDGDDYETPSFVAPDTTHGIEDAGRVCLEFLCTKPGDTDEEYFANYTPEQLAWVDECADDLAVEANLWGDE